jgi:subtilisin family serine protease
VKLADRSAFDAVRKLPYLDYIEPGNPDLQPQQSGGIGCAVRIPGWPPLYDVDGDILPRNFPLNGVDLAWKRGAQGQGITVGVVDTGIARSQTEFRPDIFVSGQSSDPKRAIRYQGCPDQVCIDSLPPEWFDECSHGTSIAGAIAAPRNGTNTVGVAFRSSLHAFKVANGVVFGDEAGALDHSNGIRAVRASGAQIIEMAFGSAMDFQSLADEIRFEFYRTDMKEVLFIGAAGTDVCPPWAPVAFPARMPEVIAVTGVNEDGSLADRSCFGPEVRLATVQQDFETPGMSPGSVIMLGGTSGASAIAAGIAALVWSKYPDMNRDAVIDRMTSRAAVSPALVSYESGLDRIGEEFVILHGPLQARC